MTKFFLALLVVLFIVSCKSGGLKKYEILSPDGNLSVVFEMSDSIPYYSVFYKDSIIIGKSKMGMILSKDIFLDRNLEIESTDTNSFNESWKPVWGQKSEILNHYNEMTVNLMSAKDNKDKISIIFRVYNDGIGFRYFLPGENKNIEILEEKSFFNLNGNYIAWYIKADFDSYEHLYTKDRIENIHNANTPVTFKTDNQIYLSIHEANLTDYPEMTLLKDTADVRSFKSELAPWPDGVKVKTKLACYSPWRVILIADSPGKLIESSLILNLNEPCRISKTDWIKPMKYNGIWWGMHLGLNTWYVGKRHGATTENMKKYIDFAADNYLGGTLAEGWNTGWEKWGEAGAFDYITAYEDFDLNEIVKYAKEKNVNIIGHHETGGDILSYEKNMEAAFKMYQKLGIHAVKTGYAGAIRPNGQFHHGQYMVNHYRKVMETAAKYEIMLDVHEPVKFTGLERTYPNLMTGEGVRGMEWNAWSEGNPPEHTVIIPFTRMLAGPVDYTPGIFDITYENVKDIRIKWNGNDKGNSRVNSTLTNQLALYVVLYSPWQMAADLPENYMDHPAFEFIRKVPVNWDDTRVLNAEIGEYVTIARKSGDSWYIGSITNEEPHDLEIEFSFLDEEKKYLAVIYADDKSTELKETPTAFKIDTISVTGKSFHKIVLAGGGGQAIIITPCN